MVIGVTPCASQVNSASGIVNHLVSKLFIVSPGEILRFDWQYEEYSIEVANKNTTAAAKLIEQM